ncbi:transcription termination factor NusA [Guggenheimella bovis]
MENIVQAIKEIAKEKDLSEDILFESIQAALVTALKKNFTQNRQPRVTIDRETGEIHVYSLFNVVEEVENDEFEMSLEDAREIDKTYNVGDVVEIEEMPKDFGRISALAAKQVVVQRIREAERSSVYDEFKNHENELVTGLIQRISNNVVYFNLGKAEALLPPKEQVRGERYRVGERMKLYLAEVKQTSKAPQLIVSRTHPGLVRRLFELEVPEIMEGDVLIKSIAREAGSRTKIAIAANHPDVDPIGSCIGPKGQRVNNIVDELSGEKIDIIEYTEDVQKYIENALSPAKVTSVTMIEEKSARVIVPDFQLSLAIGKEGQNARLAAKLTGVKIDIFSESQVQENEQA